MTRNDLFIGFLLPEKQGIPLPGFSSGFLSLYDQTEFSSENAISFSLKKPVKSAEGNRFKNRKGKSRFRVRKE
jgi:hypothetical protein